MSSGLIIIPARGGSKGIPNKNLEKVKSSNLVIRTLVHASYLAENNMTICISTDSSMILKTCAEFLGIKKFDTSFTESNLLRMHNVFLHKRDPKHATDESLISSTILELKSLMFSEIGFNGNIILLQPTTPYRSKLELIKIREIYLKNQNDRNFSFVSVKSVGEIHPDRMYIKNSEDKLSSIGSMENYYSRRQDLPEILIRDGGFYIIGSNLAQEELQYSRNPFFIERNYPWNINLDSVSDLILANLVEDGLIKDDPSEREVNENHC